MGMSNSDRMLTVAVLFGGRSGEHDVSLMSVRSVLAVLDRSRYHVVEIGITRQGTWLTGKNVLEALESGKTNGLSPVVLSPDPSEQGIHVLEGNGPSVRFIKLSDVDVFFPVLHGTFGEDGTLQGLFELADVAYVGAGVLGSSVGMDKGLFKDVMRSNGIPTPESIIVLRSEIKDTMDTVIERAEKIGAYPLFVKPANLGSSVGVTKCRSRSDLAEGLMDAAQYDRRVLVERGISAPREIEVAVLGNDMPAASIPGEIIPGADFYSYDAKYILENSELVIPASLPADQIRTFRDLAIRAYKAVDAAGMARVDFLMEKETGRIYLNEINTIPGFTKISMYPKLWEASGLPYPSLVDRLIDLALERKAERSQTLRHYRRNA
jgi:D-alanine-D-alanine ligase